MKKVLLIVLVVFFTSSCIEDGIPVVDKFDNLYKLDSLKTENVINSDTFVSNSYQRIDISSGTIFKVGIDTIPNVWFYLSDSATTVNEISVDSLYQICVILPTLTGGQGNMCAKTGKSISFTSINDSTTKIDYTGEYIIPDVSRSRFADTIYNLTGNTIFYHSLK